MNNYNNIIESLISIFTVDKGEVKILLFHKKDEPYKGYWMLPNKLLDNNTTLEENIQNLIYDTIGIEELYFEQCSIFSNIDRYPNKRIIGASYFGMIDSVSFEIKKQENPNIEMQWFSINTIPKMAYDNEEIIKESINFLRKKLVNSNILKSLFPSDFTLPELQKIYEKILDKELDRRNFRKKFINLDLVEDTGYKNEGYSGRPAKLYRFKENIPERDLF